MSSLEGEKGVYDAGGYFAVIFSSRRANADPAYDEMAVRMSELARNQPGFLGIESVRGADGNGITVSYWTTEAAIAAWKENTEHLLAQERGRNEWYASYDVRIARVERAYGMKRT